MKSQSTVQSAHTYQRLVQVLTALAIMLGIATGIPGRTAHAFNQLILNPVGGPFGMVVLRLPAGGEAAFTLEGATLGTSFVRMRVDWAAADTRVQQIRITNVPGGPILGFDLNSSIFSPQPRDPNQIVLNVQPPTRTFHDSFIFELAGGLSPSQVIGQFLIQDLTTGAQVEKSNVPIIFDPRATNTAIDLSGGGTQAGGVILGSGGQLIGGNGASVTGQVTTLPGSTVQVTQGQFTLGDGTAPVDLRGQVTVAPNTTLNFNASGKAQLGGQTDVTHGTISAPNGMNFGTPSALDASQLAGVDLEALLIALSADRSEALQELMIQQMRDMKVKNDELRNSIEPTRTQLLRDQQLDMLRLQALAIKQAATSELVNNVIKGAATIASPIVGAIRSTLAGDVEVVGSLLIGGAQDIGHTDINGTLTMHTGSHWAMEVAGTNAGQFDSVTVSGNVTFKNGSILKLGLLDPSDYANGSNPFAPQPFDFDQFDILTAAHITNNGLLLDTPTFPDRTFALGIFDSPNGTQTLRLLVGPLPTTLPDTTSPVITPNVVGTLGSNDWYRSDVAVSWTVSDPESAITSQTGCDPVTINADTTGTTLTCSATSAGGTGTQSVTIKRDATAPTLAPVVSPNPVNQGASATASPGAVDALSGLASQACDALDTSSVGAKTITCTATDNAANTGTANASYTVVAVAVAPGVSIAEAGNITPTGATLAGTVNANGADTASIVFQIGTASGNYTSNVAATPAQATGNSAISVQATLAGLTPNATYYVRLVATNAAGTTNSSEISFRTAVRVTDFVLFTTSNMTLASGGGNVNGRIAASGNLDTSRFNLGAAVTLPADTVIVNGNLSLANQTVRGNAIYGGTLTRPNTVNFTGGAPIQRANALEIANTQAYVTQVAAAWAALPSNGTTTFQYGVLRLTGANTTQNVFTVNGSNLGSASSLQINAPAGSTVIVNVSGATGRMASMGISLSAVNRNRVVFNFHQATSLTISSASVPGLVWAPGAAVSLTNGNLNGSLVASTLTGGSVNVTYDAYQGPLPR